MSINVHAEFTHYQTLPFVMRRLIEFPPCEHIMLLWLVQWSHLADIFHVIKKCMHVEVSYSLFIREF